MTHRYFWGVSSLQLPLISCQTKVLKVIRQDKRRQCPSQPGRIVHPYKVMISSNFLKDFMLGYLPFLLVYLQSLSFSLSSLSLVSFFSPSFLSLVSFLSLSNCDCKPFYLCLFFESFPNRSTVIHHQFVIVLTSRTINFEQCSRL